MAGARCKRRRRHRAHGHGARAGQRRRPVGGAVPRRARARAAKRKALRLVKGSHIVVPKLFEHDHAYIFQNPDKRIIFAIPYEGDFTLIGTTDVEHHGAIGAARIDADEIAYLCEQASRYFERAVHAGRRGVELLRRAPAARRRVGRPVGGDARLRARARHRTGRAAAARSGAARSPPSASSPKRPPTCSAAPLRRERAAPGPTARSCPAATSARLDRRRAAARHRLQPLRAGAGTAPPAAAGAAVRRLARGYGARVGTLLGDGALGAEVAPGLFEAELNYLHDARMGAQRRRRAVAAHQARPALTTRSQRAAVARLVRGALARATQVDAGSAVDGDGMELMLERIEQQVGRADPPVPARPDAGAARGDGAAGRHAGRQDHADARDGRPGQAQRRAACSPTART